MINSSSTQLRKILTVIACECSHERTLTCDNCFDFGKAVATYANLMVTSGVESSSNNDKLFIYTTEKNPLKVFEEGSEIYGVAISVEVIVSATETKTVLYSNSAPNFPKTVEIEHGGYAVATAGDKLIIGDRTDGTLIKELEYDTTIEGTFGSDVAVTENVVFVVAPEDGVQNNGVVFIYSAVTGDSIEKVEAPDAEDYDWYGSCLRFECLRFLLCR